MDFLKKHISFLLVLALGSAITIYVAINTIKKKFVEVNTNLDAIAQKKLIKTQDIFITNKPCIFATDDVNRVFCFFPTEDTIKIYDFDKKKFDSQFKIGFDTKGGYDEIVYLRTDTLLMYNWSDNHKLLVINAVNGDVERAYDMNPGLSQELLDDPPTVYLSGTLGEIKDGDDIFLAAYNLGEEREERRYCGIKLNLNSGLFEYTNSYPEIYDEFNWGVFYYYFPFTVAIKNQTIVCSFPNSHNLYVYNTRNKSTKTVAGGSNRIGRIDPFDTRKETINNLKESYINYYFTTPSYGSINYDPYRDVYVLAP